MISVPKMQIANTANMNLPTHLLVTEVILGTIRWIGIVICVELISQAAIDIARTHIG